MLLGELRVFITSVHSWRHLSKLQSRKGNKIQRFTPQEQISL